MNKKLYSLLIFVVAFALVFGFGAINNSKAASDNFNGAYVGQDNLVGIDEADNGLTTSGDRDRGSAPQFGTYGLSGNWEDSR